MTRAAGGRAVWAVVEPTASLVVPASYRRHERFDMLCGRFAAQGWPVHVRPSGGGLVPQGPGVVDVSLAWPTDDDVGVAMGRAYDTLCRVLLQALSGAGVQAAPQAVAGSFCDGRYNLAQDGMKVAGTAQYWRRVSPARHVVLAHACVLVQADLDTLVERANAFEAQLGSDRQYDRAAVTNVRGPHGAPPVDEDGRALTMTGWLARFEAATAAWAAAPPGTSGTPQAPRSLPA